jgi:hypothetical protein
MSSQNVQYGKNVTLFFISLPFAERQQVNLLRFNGLTLFILIVQQVILMA